MVMQVFVQSPGQINGWCLVESPPEGWIKINVDLSKRMVSVGFQMICYERHHANVFMLKVKRIWAC